MPGFFFLSSSSSFLAEGAPAAAAGEATLAAAGSSFFAGVDSSFLAGVVAALAGALAGVVEAGVPAAGAVVGFDGVAAGFAGDAAGVVEAAFDGVVAAAGLEASAAAGGFVIDDSLPVLLSASSARDLRVGGRRPCHGSVDGKERLGVGWKDEQK
jgi:hypothetical protein